MRAAGVAAPIRPARSRLPFWQQSFDFLGWQAARQVTSQRDMRRDTGAHPGCCSWLLRLARSFSARSIATDGGVDEVRHSTLRPHDSRVSNSSRNAALPVMSRLRLLNGGKELGGISPRNNRVTEIPRYQPSATRAGNGERCRSIRARNSSLGHSAKNSRRRGIGVRPARVAPIRASAAADSARAGPAPRIAGESPRDPR